MSGYAKEVPPVLKDFVETLAWATNTHNFNNVAPYIHLDATYWFSDGTELKGLDQIREAFNRSWEEIPNEQYGVSKVRWPLITGTAAVYQYLFNYSGNKPDGEQISGNGRGTNVLTREQGTWFVIHEHLSR